VHQVRDGAISALAGYFVDLIGQLAAAGARIAAISAVTPHICARALAGISSLPLVDPIQETSRELSGRSLKIKHQTNGG